MRQVLGSGSSGSAAGVSSAAGARGLVVLVLSGCFGPGPAAPQPDTGTQPPPGSQTARDVRLGSVADGNQARLSDVVVVGPVDLDGDRFFVQDLGGGPYAGLQVRMAPGVPLPEVGEGDVLSLTGNAIATGERIDLWLRSDEAVLVTGSAAPAAEILETQPRDWAPWFGQPVTVSDLTITGCPVGDTLDTDLVPVSAAWHDARLARGDVLAVATGVLVPVGFDATLWPRRPSDLERTGDGEGCTLTAAEAQADEVVGRVALPRVVRTTPAAEGGETWVQDPGGAAGLLVLDGPGAPGAAALLSGVAVGQAAALEGELVWTGGRLALVPSAVVPGGVVGAVAVPVAAIDEARVGQLVRVEDLTVGEPVSYGAWETDLDLVLGATLLRPLPLSVGTTLDAVVGVVDPWPDGTLSLLPRSSADLEPGP